MRPTALPLAVSLLVAVAAIGIAPPRASAQERAEAPRDPLARVPALLEALDYDAAATAIDDALRSGALSPRDVARAYVFRGVMAAGRKDAPRAEREFARAVRIDPAAALPPGQAPHVQSTFDRARASASPPLDARVTLGPTSARRDLRVRVAVTGDPDHLARRAEVRTRAGAAVDAPVSGDAAEITVDAARHACAPLRVRLLDAFGNDLFDAGEARPTCAAEPPPVAARADATSATSATPSAAAPSRPMPVYAWGGVAATGALAITTAVLGVVALDRRASFDAANRDPTRVSERAALRDDAVVAERNATIAGVATALVGGIALVLVLTRPTTGAPLTASATARAIDLAWRF